MATSQQPAPKYFTWRVQNIPHGFDETKLGTYFYTEDKADITIKSLCPAVDTPEGAEGECTATVYFRRENQRPRFVSEVSEVLDIDKTFIGFTPLYVPTKEKGPIAAECVLSISILPQP